MGKALFISGVSGINESQEDVRQALADFTGLDVTLYNPSPRFGKTPLASINHPFAFWFEVGEVIESIFKTKAFKDILDEIGDLITYGHYETIIAHSLGTILVMAWATKRGLAEEIRTLVTIASPVWYPCWYGAGVDTEEVRVVADEWVNYSSLIDPVSAGNFLLGRVADENRWVSCGHQIEDYLPKIKTKYGKLF